MYYISFFNLIIEWRAWIKYWIPALQSCFMMHYKHVSWCTTTMFHDALQPCFMMHYNHVSWCTTVMFHDVIRNSCPSQHLMLQENLMPNFPFQKYGIVMEMKIWAEAEEKILTTIRQKIIEAAEPNSLCTNTFWYQNMGITHYHG